LFFFFFAGWKKGSMLCIVHVVLVWKKCLLCKFEKEN